METLTIATLTRRAGARGEPPTIGSRLDEVGGIGVGFDTLRVVLALAVVMCHQQMAMFGTSFPTSPPFWLISSSLLPMFFALAGFLIAGSADRLSPGPYFVNRALRIFPALIAETILSAVVLGLLFTTLPLGDYAIHPQTLTYFGNVIGWVQFNLPGVFEDNPHGGVNWSLWTIPFELRCYVLGALLAPLLAAGRAWLLLAAAIGWFHVSALLNEMSAADGDPLRILADHVFIAEGDALFVCFLLGYAAFGLRYRIRYSPVLAAGIAVALLIVASTGIGVPVMAPLVWVAVSYLTLFIGVSRLPRLPLLGRGDYSYGIYLYGIPVQQAVRAAMPGVQNSWVLLAAVLLILLPLAMASWHLIERPMLRLRKRYSFVVRARGISEARDSKVSAPPPTVDPATGRVLSFGSVRTEERPPTPSQAVREYGAA